MKLCIRVQSKKFKSTFGNLKCYQHKQTAVHTIELEQPRAYTNQDNRKITGTFASNSSNSPVLKHHISGSVLTIELHTKRSTY